MNTIKYSTTRFVEGGKEYQNGNHVWLANRTIYIEFDSDFTIRRSFKGKNWVKLAIRQIELIPSKVTINWLAEHGYEVPQECFKFCTNTSPK
jgi:hypothetical protein